MKPTKVTFKRAARTFLQAALVYTVINIFTVDFSSGKEVAKTALIGLGVSALAAGAAAVMNLQSTADPDTECGASGSMTYDSFVKAYLGKSTDWDGAYGVQCVDLIKAYLYEVFGIKAASWGDARCYYENYNKISALKNNFTLIANSSSFVPQKGDICVWSGKISSSNNCGHIAIATGEGNAKEFYTYDQNWNGKPMKKVKHNKSAFYGVLRPKNRSKIITAPTFKSGSTYTLTSNVKVRTGAGTNYAQKKVSQLTADGRKNCTSTKTSDYAVLKSGTKVTAKTVKTVGSDVWIEIPSGWIAAYYNGNTYAK